MEATGDTQETAAVPFLIVGGGIAGVSCAEQLSLECPDKKVIVVSSSPLIKAVTNVRKVTSRLEAFDVEEKAMSTLEQLYPNVRIIHDVAAKLDSNKHELHLASGKVITYNKICICTGGVPKLIAADNPYVLGIRDTESVKSFQAKLENARRIVIVGNGGIATELVYEIENCQIIWAVKHSSIGATFFDAGAAEFFLPHLGEKSDKNKKVCKRIKYTIQDTNVKIPSGSQMHGSALGPDWASQLKMKGRADSSHEISVEYQCEVEAIYTPEEFKLRGISEHTSQDGPWPVYVQLTNNHIYGCDFVISATGVVPNTAPFMEGNQFEVADDGGLVVNDQMEISTCDVYAAGDVCTIGWKPAQQWFQMRLWTQARQMGAYAAHCMALHSVGEKALLDFCFELFAHVTNFFGYKVVLLGLYNAQGLDKNYELLVRVTPGEEYVKVILNKEGRMQGAVLIGDTDLEETFENLILNQMDLSSYGEDLLNPNIDIEDYFD